MILIVTGTDTGVGKTVTTAALAVRAGPGTIAVKPAQTGVGTDEPDIRAVAHLAGCEVVEFTRLEDPLAPDTAARLRGVEIPPVGAHAARVRELARKHDTVVVEGAGGLLVRLDTSGGTLLDLAADLARDHPVRIYVVTRIGLGTLNHTELTVGALRSRGLEPAGLVLGAVPDELGLAEQCNRTELPRVTGVPVVAAFPDGAGSLAPERFRERVGTWLSAVQDSNGEGTLPSRLI
ncbi:8-amino-7-oxononanoate synthase/dethiobiotin synthetase [Saccharopolyspora antimicrobica]|uniref:ATP-dependent dethiobiotin synthetase BioD n=1 Tax=Saccharopolyspora antimicrobica TaxID=455193 RepID=A0A1I5GN01_9PSEU|nr:8-amino-7-oxononanoate synthase/dethiobiotin synthetase [Saccharopolyspora antimicrobica]SFO37365.1 8-amino-7-oxononanoate synthase/dethiobiotin synthetase [Saccharopolyspora antimicrobica]